MSARHLVTKLLGVAALASLVGCATAPRSYYSEGGDYYYGAPRADVIVDYSSSYGYPGWRYGLGGYGGGYGYGGYYGGYGYYGAGYGYGYGYSPWWGYGGYHPGWRPQYTQPERRARVDPDIAFRQGATGRERPLAPRSASFAPARTGATAIRQSSGRSPAFAPRPDAIRSSGYAPAMRAGTLDNRGAPLSGIGPRVQSSPSPAARRPSSIAPRQQSFQPQSAPRAAPSYRSAPAPSRAPVPASRSQSAPTRK